MSSSNDASTYTSPVTGATGTGPSRTYEMNSTATQDRLSTSESDDESALPNGSSDALLAHKLPREYQDEERSHEFDLREKEDIRARERLEAREQNDATMWWLKRATLGAALYAIGSVVVFRVLPAWFSSEEGEE